MQLALSYDEEFIVATDPADDAAYEKLTALAQQQRVEADELLARTQKRREEWETMVKTMQARRETALVARMRVLAARRHAEQDAEDAAQREADAAARARTVPVSDTIGEVEGACAPADAS